MNIQAKCYHPFRWLAFALYLAFSTFDHATAQPNWSNTGIRVPESSLTTVGGLTISTPNTVISNLFIKGRLTIDNVANNTTIRNCKITGDIYYGLIIYATNTLIEDCTFQGPNLNFTVTASNSVFTVPHHGFTNGTEVNLFATGSINPTGNAVLPSGLREKVRYFVTNATTDTFQLSGTLGGSLLLATVDGTGQVEGPNSAQQYAVAPADGGTFTANRLNICATWNGLALGDHSLIENCWVHHLWGGIDNHVDCIQCDGLMNSQIISNVLDCTAASGQDAGVNTGFGPDATIALFADPGFFSANVTIAGNWLDGGGLMIQGGHDGPTPDTNVVIINNIIGSDFLFSVLSGSLTGVIWSNNVWQVNGGQISYNDAVGYVPAPAPPLPSLVPSFNGITCSNNSITVNIHNQSNIDYIIQQSSNLVNWVSIMTNRDATGLRAIPLNTSGQQGYFRALLAPGEFIWPAGKVSTSDNADSVPYELGTLFSSTVPGNIIQVRIYVLSEESGAHNIRIWRNSDNTLVDGPFSWTFGGVSGWQTINIPAVAIEANVSYTVSISTGTDAGKHYPSIPGDLNSPGNNGGHLLYPANAGVYSTTPGICPVKTIRGNNYLRDVVFVPHVTN